MGNAYALWQECGSFYMTNNRLQEFIVFQPFGCQVRSVSNPCPFGFYPLRFGDHCKLNISGCTRKFFSGCFNFQTQMFKRVADSSKKHLVIIFI